jgi:hypothetical protein
MARQLFKGIPLGYGFDFYSELSNEKAIAILRDSPLEICQSFYSQYQTRRHLSYKQWFWVYYFAEKATGVKVLM